MACGITLNALRARSADESWHEIPMGTTEAQARKVHQSICRAYMYTRMFTYTANCPLYDRVSFGLNIAIVIITNQATCSYCWCGSWVCISKPHLCSRTLPTMLRQLIPCLRRP
jgi:hypothetical protein